MSLKCTAIIQQTSVLKKEIEQNLGDREDEKITKLVSDFENNTSFWETICNTAIEMRDCFDNEEFHLKLRDGPDLTISLKEYEDKLMISVSYVY